MTSWWKQASNYAFEQPADSSRSWQGGSRVTRRVGAGQERSVSPLLNAFVMQHATVTAGGHGQCPFSG